MTIAEYVVREVGFWNGQKVLAFIMAWESARAALGQESMTLDEYRDWWRTSERTAYREQALFRRAFPDYGTPDELLALARSQRVAVQELRWA